MGRILPGSTAAVDHQRSTVGNLLRLPQHTCRQLRSIVVNTCVCSVRLHNKQAGWSQQVQNRRRRGGAGKVSAAPPQQFGRCTSLGKDNLEVCKTASSPPHNSIQGPLNSLHQCTVSKVRSKHRDLTAELMLLFCMTRGRTSTSDGLL